MKLLPPSAFVARLCTTLLGVMLCLQFASAQGPLTPPGAPAPTMKSLEQVEPRIPISSLPYMISASGSYYLTKNLTVASGNGIIIGSDDVTVDLNGFTISSTAASGGNAIIFSSTSDNVTIRDGHISGGVFDNGSTFSGPGFDNGISDGGSVMQNIRVMNVSIRGMRNNGIDLITGPASSIVDSCSVETAGAFGIRAYTVRNSKAAGCGREAITAGIVDGSIGAAVRTGDGINGYNVSNSYGYALGNGTGLTGATVTNCYGSSGEYDSFSGYGINATSAINSYGTSVRYIGLNAETAMNCNGKGETAGVSVNLATNSTGTSTAGIGLRAFVAANGCYGSSSNGRGLEAYYLATGCVGVSSTGSAGLHVTGIASYCSGLRYGGTAIKAVVAIGCSTFGGIVDCQPGAKYLGTP